MGFFPFFHFPFLRGLETETQEGVQVQEEAK